MEEKGEDKSWMSEEEFKLVKEKTPIPHVDLVFLRKAEGKWETLIFDRKTGPWSGHTCLIGGRQRKGERILKAIARQAAEVGFRVRILKPFKSDFPSYVDANLDQDTQKQATTLVYPVVIAGRGPKGLESNEVLNARWLPVDQLPTNMIPHHTRKILETVGRLEKLNPDPQ